MNKKILIIANNSGGLYCFRGMLISKMIENGYKVYGITPFDDNVDDLKELGIHLINVPMERRGMNPLKDMKLLKTYLHIIRKLKPDMVVTYTVKPNAYGGIACRLCKVPYASNITGLGTAFQNEGLLRKFVIFLYKVALKNAKVVFFENKENLQIIVDSGIIRRNQAYLLHGAGVDLEKFSLIPYPMDEEETRFLFIGRLMKEKGIDELFQAMKMLQKDGIKCSLDILGEYDEDYATIVKQYETEGWLRFHGYQLDVRPFIANCHCFVLPSWHEGMANTNLECAASGRPVITSNIHGCLEAVEDGVTGYLCEKKNLRDLYNVMKKFCMLDKEDHRDMGMKGRMRMEKLFDKKEVVKETVKEILK